MPYEIPFTSAIVFLVYIGDKGSGLFRDNQIILMFSAFNYPLSIPQFQLVLDEIIVCTPLGYERVVVALLHDAPIIDDHYLVGILHRAQAVGYDYYRAILVEVLHVLGYLSLVLRVERVCRFVEEDERSCCCLSPAVRTTVVYHLPPAKEQGYPRPIECATEDEDGEYQPVVNQEYDAEDDEAQQREHHRQRLPHQEVVHPQVVAHSLHQVAHQLGVEERHRQFQQLHEEVVDERDVYLHRYSTFGRSQSPYG